MNVNTQLIDAICNKYTSSAQPFYKGSMTSEGKQFSLILDDTSSKIAPYENATSNNVDKDSKKTITEKETHEFELVIHEKRETKTPLKDQEKIGSEELSLFSDIHEQPDLELTLQTEEDGFFGQSSEIKSEEIAKTQPISLSADSQTINVPPNIEEIVELTHIEHVGPHENQVKTGGILDNISQSTRTTLNHSETTENTDIIPILKPIEIPEQPNAPNQSDNIEGLISDKHIVTAGMKDTIADHPITSEPSVPVDNQEKLVSSTKSLIADAFENSDGKTITGDDQAATMTNTGLKPAETKTSETHLNPIETNPEKRAPTVETIPELQYTKDKELTHTGDNLSNISGLKVLNVSEIQTSTVHSEAQGRSTDNNNSQGNFKQILPQNDNPTPIIQQSVTSVEDAKSNPLSEQSLPNEISANVSKQILESIQNSLTHQDTNQQITVRLNPPELGKVFIKFQEQNSELTGSLEVNKAETRIEIEQALPQIIRDLANAGIQIRRLDVVLSEENRSGYEALEDQSSQNGGLYEQNSTGSQAWDNDAYTNGMNDWSTKNANHQPVSEFDDMQMGEGSINMLI